MTHKISILVILAILTFANFNSAYAQVSQSEFDALVAFYNATNGDNWTDNSNWDINATPADVTSDWYGLTVANGHITEINMADNGNNLTGYLPTQIGNFPNLTNLWLQSNSIGGDLPSEIYNLTLLTSFNLAHNQFTGSISANISNLVNLPSLILNGNELSGNIPNELWNLTNLTQIMLDNNDFTGEISISIGNSTNLSFLGLGGNQLSGNIPNELWDLTNLTFLNLGGNNLTGEISALIGNLTNLSFLDFASNELSGSLPSELWSISNLSYLSIRNNLFEGEFPTGIGSLTNLSNLSIDNNQFTGSLPDEIGTLSNLSSLFIFNNLLTNLPDLTSTNLSSGNFWTQNNYLTFASIEPNYNLFNGSVDYSPQNNWNVTTYLFELNSGDNLILNATDLAVLDLGGINNRYQWFKNETAVTEITDNPEYSISSVSQSDIGTYYCEVTNINVPDLIIRSNNISVTVDGISSIFNNSTIKATIFPNPTNGVINIKTNEQIEKITILDISGKIILETTNTEIDLSKQKTGTYFVKIETENGIFTEKTILK